MLSPNMIQKVLNDKQIRMAKNQAYRVALLNEQDYSTLSNLKPASEYQ
jgi:hypothetical protein